MNRYCIITLIIYLLLQSNLASAQILIEPIMKSVVTDSIPVPKKWKDLCETEEGRKSILASLDTLELKDLRFQWEGIKSSDTSYSVTLDEFLMQNIEMRCTPLPGGQIMLISDTTRANFIFKDEFWCESRNTGGSHEYDCNEKYQLVLPVGWQVCKLTYDESHKRHGKYKFEPIFYKHDNQSPPRVVGYTLYLTGHGDVGNPSKIRISNIRIFAIRDYYGNNERLKCDCQMPTPEIPVQKPSPNNSQPTVNLKSPANITWQITNKRTNAADFIIQNTGGSPGRLYFRILVQDGDDGQWDRYEEGYIDLPPNSIFNKGLHKWRALDWKMDSFSITSIP